MMINQKSYRYWVIVGGKIESGWDFRADATEQLDNLPFGKAGKVYARAGLRMLGLDPDSDADWHTGLWWKGEDGRIAVARDLVAVANRIIAGPVDDIVGKYPIRDKRWDWLPAASKFVTDASSLRDVFTDPWKRPIPRTNVREVRNRDNDVERWDCWTTVAGVRVNMVVWND